VDVGLKTRSQLPPKLPEKSLAINVETGVFGLPVLVREAAGGSAILLLWRAPMKVVCDLPGRPRSCRAAIGGGHLPAMAISP